MPLGQLFAQMWELPWYKLITVAFVDDVFLFLRLWWLWLVIFVVVLVLGLVASQ